MDGVKEGDRYTIDHNVNSGECWAKKEFGVLYWDGECWKDEPLCKINRQLRKQKRSKRKTQRKARRLNR